MRFIRWACLLTMAAVLFAPSYRALSSGAAIDEAFDRFWSAHTPGDAEKLIGDILKTDISFDAAWNRLKAGRSYKTQKSGVALLNNRTKDGATHYFSVNVPQGYDPAKPWQLRFQLHGGIGGRVDNLPRGTGEIGQLAGAEQFYVLPYAWIDEPWWSDDQVLNLDAILDQVKRTYNIDENRVVVSGVSDGGTGTYYVAMRETTPFASFLPLNGFIMVLASFDDDRMFPSNLLNKPLFAVNGGRDPLYPTEIVDPYIKHLIKDGVDITYHPQPDAGHNTSWWPNMKDAFEAFVTNHPRDPHPDRLTWETADLSNNRAHWLVIDQLGATANDSKDLTDLNVMADADPMALFAPPPSEMFDRNEHAGRVSLVRTGNTVQATTKGVTAFTLLLSPDAFDLNKPVHVAVNGRNAFDGVVPRNLETLLKWAARDNDRTMLYGAEIQIRVK